MFPALLGLLTIAYQCRTIPTKVITVPTDKVVVTEKYKDTTIFMPPNTYVIKDSTVCPPSTGDTTIYKTITYNTEGKTVTVKIPYSDTLRITNDTAYVRAIVEKYEKSLADQKALTDHIISVINTIVWTILVAMFIAFILYLYTNFRK